MFDIQGAIEAEEYTRSILKIAPYKTPTIPYIYHLLFKITGQHYIGARYADGCHPDELLTIGHHKTGKVGGLIQGGYQTTSEVVWELIDEYGLGSFEVIFIKRLTYAWEALKYEKEVLSSIDAANDPMFLNEHNGGGTGFVPRYGEDHHWYGQHGWNKGIPHSEEHRKKIGLAQLGKTLSEEHIAKLKARTLSEEQKEHLRLINLGKTLSAETKAKIRLASTGRIKSEETRAKLRKPKSEAGKANMRGPKSESHGKNIGLALLGKRRPEMAAKMRMPIPDVFIKNIHLTTTDLIPLCGASRSTIDRWKKAARS